MLEPVTAGVFASLGAWLIHHLVPHLAGHVVHETFIHEPVGELKRHILDRIPGLFGIPANHDVARALRVAQLQALDRVLREYGHSKRGEGPAHPGGKSDEFLKAARRFIGTELRLGREPELEGRPELKQSLESSGKMVLDALAAAPRKREARVAEDAVLDELRGELKAEVPPEFARYFRGEKPGVTSWFTLFSAYLAEQLKTNDRFRNILMANVLGDLRRFGLETRDVARVLEAQAEKIAARLGEIEGKIDRQIELAVRTEGKVGALHESLERFMAERAPAIVSETVVPLATWRAIVVAFGEQLEDGEIAPSRVEQVLRKRAGEYLSYKEQFEKLYGSNSGGRTARYEGRFDEAREMLIEDLRLQRRGQANTLVELGSVAQDQQRGPEREFELGRGGGRGGWPCARSLSIRRQRQGHRKGAGYARASGDPARKGEVIDQ